MRRSAVLFAVVVASGCSSAEGERGDVAAEEGSPRDTYAATPVAGPAESERIGESTSAIAHQRDRVTPVMSTSFEPASAACNGWAVEGADAIRSVPPHSGEYACKICATGDAPEIAIGRVGGALEPGRYVLTAWLRSRPNTPAPEGAVALLEATTAGGAVTASTRVVLGEEYVRVTVTLELAQRASSIQARIGASASKKECVLIDDVLVEHAP